MSDQKLIIGYYRLSMEDDSEGESNSIINQRKLVKDYISNIPELASMPFQEFYDDGYSGSSMERPAIKQVLELARENKVQCIVVKDFSRFARNYIEMGTYLEQTIRKLEKQQKKEARFLRSLLELDGTTRINAELAEGLIESMYLYGDGRLEINFGFKGAVEHE